MKAKIFKVGKVVNGQPVEFGFDCEGVVIGISDSPETLWGGWTLAELREIASRPDEFLCTRVS